MLQNDKFYKKFEKKMWGATDKRHIVLVKGLTYNAAKENWDYLRNVGFKDIISLASKFNNNPKAVKLVCEDLREKQKLINTRIFINNEAFLISPTINIMQCFNCKKFNHNKGDCQYMLTCRKCGQHEHDEDCQNTNIYCVNCESNEHESMDRRCPTYKKLCKQEEQGEINLLTSNSPNSYLMKKTSIKSNSSKQVTDQKNRAAAN